MTETRDPSSSANTAHHHTKHLKFNWALDFAKHVISGTATLTVESVGQGHNQLTLDSKLLTIISVKVDGKQAHWELTTSADKFMGSCLVVTSCPVGKKEFTVEVAYETSPDSTALQWLDAKMTADKHQPFVYSQCQAIHARSLFPCQDTPQVKSTYEACVSVPKDIVVVMSAVRDGEPKPLSRGDGWMQFSYKQTVPMPAYLVAIAAGEIASKSIGPRSTVWAEPSVVEKAAYEFAHTDDMLKAAESLCGPYVWGVYDILILPPSFPYGGMENPCLTFITPTLLAGDRSLVSVVAHEISHSWTGNLVTNCNWEHFWLNEGHTVYLERLVMEKLHNNEMRQLLLSSGYQELLNEVETLGATNQVTKLVVNLDHLDPDVAYSRIPYEKGSLLLYMLELKVGKDNMMSWLKAYVKQFANTALDSPTWLTFFKQHMAQLGKPVDDVDWEHWLHTPGLPSWKPKFEADRVFMQCTQLENLFVDAQLTQDVAKQDKLVSLWNDVFPVQRTLALNHILANCLPVVEANLAVIKDKLKMSQQTNAQIRLAWALVCAKSHFMPGLDDCIAFVNCTGRFKYIRPLYRALYAWKEIQTKVVDNFKTQRPFMHQTTAMLIAQDLGL